MKKHLALVISLASTLLLSSIGAIDFSVLNVSGSGGVYGAGGGGDVVWLGGRASMTHEVEGSWAFKEGVWFSVRFQTGEPLAYRFLNDGVWVNVPWDAVTYSSSSAGVGLSDAEYHELYSLEAPQGFEVGECEGILPAGEYVLHGVRFWMPTTSERTTTRGRE